MIVIFLYLWKDWQSTKAGLESMYYVDYSYYHGLEVKVGRTYRVPLYFTCAFVVVVAHKNFELSYVVLGYDSLLGVVSRDGCMV